MKTRNRLAAALAALLVVGGVATMVLRHGNLVPVHAAKTTADMLPGAPPTANAVAGAIRDARLDVDGLDVRVAEGIVILRGRTSSDETRDRAAQAARGLGVARVANMITVDHRISDAEIARTAERRLVTSPGLEGCHFAVSCESGVLRVRGTIASELQKETAARLLRHINGVVDVQTDLQKAPDMQKASL